MGVQGTERSIDTHRWCAGEDPRRRGPRRAAGRATGAPERRVELIERLVAAGLARHRGRLVRVAEGGAGDGRRRRGGRRRCAIEPTTTSRCGRWCPTPRAPSWPTAAGVDHLTITVSASPAYSEKNVHMTIERGASTQVAAIRAAAPDAVLDAVISCCFGSPFEGEQITPDDVAALVDQARDDRRRPGHARRHDRDGDAAPRRRGARRPPGRDVGLHLHDTRGTALLNAWTAIELGVDRFDTALGGLGGSPFAPAAGGNLATEDLVHGARRRRHRDRHRPRRAARQPDRCWPSSSATTCPAESRGRRRGLMRATAAVGAPCTARRECCWTRDRDRRAWATPRRLGTRSGASPRSKASTTSTP